MVKYEREKFVDFVRRLREKWGVYSPDRRIVRNVRVWNCKEAGRKNRKNQAVKARKKTTNR